jgi:F-type H+-transporting ATPase subunit delta
MAELATIARPYAEALFKAAGGAAAGLTGQMSVLAAVAGDAQLRQFADNPKVGAAQVFEVVTGAAQTALDPKVSNLLAAVIENGRLNALPEIAAQFTALVNAQSGSSDATVYSAFPSTTRPWPTWWHRWRSASVASSRPGSRSTPNSSAASAWWWATKCSTPR